jgi:L-cysteine/cystine lyase
MTDLQTFRAQFPVLAHLAYLNAGTEGPVPTRAARAAQDRIELEMTHGRCGRPFFEAVLAMATQLRERYAKVLGCAPDNLALTGSTTDGVNTVIAGLDLRPGDEILTSQEEHPGLLAPLGRARRRQRVSVRMVPFAELPGEVSDSTRLIACSHVSWASGQIADVDALTATGRLVLLDGAQGIGAIPVDVHELGVDFYAASGQKWLCGPEGSGCLYVRTERLEELTIPWPGYGSLADPHAALELEPAAGAARFDHGFPVGVRCAWALASLDVLTEPGLDWVQTRAATLAERLAERLRERDVEVSPRGRSTLVSWSSAAAPAEVQRLAELGFVVRNIPEFDRVRASVGAWNSEEEVDQLATQAGSS